jgi:hypothetical protein
VSLVKKDASMLDVFGKGASDDIRDAKNVVYEVGLPSRPPSPHGAGGS